MSRLSLAASLRLPELKVAVRIGQGVSIAPQVLLDPMYPELIELEEGCFLGFGYRIIRHEYSASHFRLKPMI